MKKGLIILLSSVLIVAVGKKYLYPIYVNKITNFKNRQKAENIVSEIEKLKLQYDSINKKYIGTQSEINKLLSYKKDLKDIGFDYNYEIKTLLQTSKI
jgi:Tfp pilus assembly protein PilE